MGSLLTASVASAQTTGQGFGEKGQFIFSADRLVPIIAFTQNRFNDDNDNITISQNGSSLSLLWGNNSVFSGGSATGLVVNGNGGVATGGGNPTFYTTPRVGFDYVLVPNLTLGGDLFVFFTLGGSTSAKQGNTTTTTDLPSGNAFGVAPRVGYVIGLNPLLSIWLRGGFSFYHAGTSVSVNNCSNDRTTALNVVGLDVDPQLVISPLPHFAFEVGPAIDWGFAGSASVSTPSNQNCNTTITTSFGYTAYNFGITGGLLGWF
jgi:hypothetical protein